MSSRRPYMRELLFVYLVLLCFMVTAYEKPAGAEEPLTGTLRTMNPRAVGMGGALRASPAGTASMYMNPALISMAPQYHVEGVYQYTGPGNMHTGGAAIVDSVTTVIGAGLAFNYSGVREPRTKHDSYDVRVALSGGFGGVLYVGAMGRYLFLEQNKSSNKWGPAGKPALPASGHQQVDGMTFDAGMGLQLGEVFRLGVAGYNLTNTGSIFAPIELGCGISLSFMKMLLFELDTVIDFTSHDKIATELDFGAEVFLMNTIAIRGGYDYNFFYKIHAPSAGLGYVHSRFGVDLGFMKEARKDGRMVISFGLKLFVN